MTPPFRDRRHAGRQLAKLMKPYAGRSDVVVLGLARGGVPVAFEVARALRAPLDVFVVRKLGVPGNEELAMGAIAPDGVRIIHWDTLTSLAIDDATLESVIRHEQLELERRELAYRPREQRRSLAGRVVVLVDDGLATGASMRAAVAAAREHRPARLVVGVPIAAHSTCQALHKLADEVICSVTAERFVSVGSWYEDFSQTRDEEVRQVLRLAATDLERRQALSPGAAVL